MYNTHGQVTRTWGDAAYPVRYVYNGYDLMVEMHTYRAGEGFAGETFPSVSESDVTRWEYHEATGLLTAKEDAATKRTTYTYAPGGRLLTRIWARTGTNNSPVVTTYGCDENTGELTSIDYSDDTPDIAFTYDRMGRQHTVTDAVGTRTFVYNGVLQLASETITGMYNATITRTYEEEGVPGREKGFTLGDNYRVGYGYDQTGQFNAVNWNIGTVTGSAEYAYVPDTDLLHLLFTASGQRIEYAYEPHRNLKTRVRNASTNTLISQYDYTYDAIGRRTSVIDRGAAFTDAAFTLYGYNDRNELTSANRYLGTDTSNTSTPVAPNDRAYTYDPIGNRKEASVWDKANSTANQLTYTANQLNQYSLITGSTGSSESLEYDDDGNMTAMTRNGSTKRLTYNAENRLVTVAPQSPSQGDTSVSFVYDYMGRRIRKTVHTYDSGTWSRTSDKFFAYNGWNMVLELKSGQDVETKSYVWGLDLSQTLQGAGGVGGLVAMVDGAESRYFCYDGNGNVGQVVNAADGTIAAHYEYDPYGNINNASGSEWQDNPYRFSTKYFDSGTNLYYYGYRFFAPEIGKRQVNRI